MDRRTFTQGFGLLTAGVLLPVGNVYAKTYLTVEQAKNILWGEMSMSPQLVELSKAQMKSIRASSKVRVRNPRPQVWKTANGGWFIVDQVIGKHENIDMAYALEANGSVRGLEILSYRESYGDEVMNPKWRAQFSGKDHRQRLKLDHQIKNISGATLSSRHITEGINRLTQTWEQVLRHL